jgi:hypothetical protein
MELASQAGHGSSDAGQTKRQDRSDTWRYKVKTHSLFVKGVLLRLASLDEEEP